MVRMIRRSAASSSGVQAAKLLVFTVDALAAAYPSSACVLLLLLAEALGLGDLERRQRLGPGDAPRTATHPAA